ncbi:hypothetical protein CAPTEDRAFT_221832 [Capitella teleta]|uniref:Tetraspanin n=1 Tax=Capitella teleta TaxID=283909 RepID=R7VIX2_CAPTE|nr:hypothetical protein CAPTEDRAFT_221832 [Capitella teleta]|eukprot:ELU16226.1 hypothetical protein CAPTEDRAFT_221832 [Capitella teleta]
MTPHQLESKLSALSKKAPLECVLLLASGLISLLSCWNASFNVHVGYFKQIYLPEGDTDVVKWMLVMMGALAAFSITIGGTRLISKKYLPFKLFVFTSVLILLFNFIVGLVLTESRKKVHLSLEPAMRATLRESIIANQRFGVGYALGEAWDYLHLKMHCCGIDSYRDYFETKGIQGDEVFPLTCCVMRKEDGEVLLPENERQCRLDANRNLRSSKFIHSQGCLQGLTRWLMRYLSKVTALLFAAICMQAIAIIYLSWLSYKKNILSKSSTSRHE